ncbi:MAG: substrate-binding domain-containing protein, partial [Oscillospiraceae bacterium]|nr:substrate-binding domain-containing protein [Oscillospiraceae bacterium]
MAYGAMKYAQHAGIRIPEDLSIIGFDDSALSTSAVPQLTTVSHPKDHMGSDAARTLLHWIHGAITGPSDTIYRPELVIRQSVLDLHTK